MGGVGYVAMWTDGNVMEKKRDGLGEMMVMERR